MPEEVSHNILANGTKIHVRQIGTGRSLIFLHGFPQNSHGWDHLIPYLPNYQLNLIDLRGLGDSELCFVGHDKRQLAEDVKSVIEQLNLKDVILLGHDIGGLISQRFALDYPHLPTKLICISTASIGKNHNNFFLTRKQLLKSWYIFLFQLPFIPEFISDKFHTQFLNKAFSHASKETNYSKEKLERIKFYCKPQLTKPRNKAAINLYRNIKKDKEANLEDRLKKFKLPTLWIQGENDPFIPPKELSQLDRFEYLTTLYIPGRGHWLPDLSPEIIGPAIVKFIEES